MEDEDQEKFGIFLLRQKRENLAKYHHRPLSITAGIIGSVIRQVAVIFLMSWWVRAPGPGSQIRAL